MKVQSLALIILVCLSTFDFAQGYLRNDDVTNHMTGITINEISAWSNPVDYNCDGVVEGGDKDEFIELANEISVEENLKRILSDKIRRLSGDLGVPFETG